MLFFATCPPGIADLLALELKECGATEVRESRSGVQFAGTLEAAYRACLWSRCANRVLLTLGSVAAHNAQALYDGVRGIDWSNHLSVNGTFAIDFSGTSPAIANSQFGALKTKDAIVDQFRGRDGARPSVDTDRPHVRINVHLHREHATVSVDLAGESLHRRGYRARGVAAPLKENLAAAILLRSGWPALATEGATFLDPLAGSGTLVLEAALIACDIAPGLLREYFGFLGWRGHDPGLWRRLTAEARERRTSGVERFREVLRGYDADAAAVRAAIENAARVNLAGVVHFERRSLEDMVAPAVSPGLLATNPPYGERIGDVAALRGLYATLGEKLRTHCVGWKAAVFTGNPPLAREIHIHAKRSHTLFNGAIECRLLRFDVLPEYFDTPESKPSEEEQLAAARQRPGAQMFANRLAKNLKTLSAWARREEIYCYRLYDADMPEYAFAIDVYGSGAEAERWLYVQEYAAPDTIAREAARQRRSEALAVIPEVFGIPRQRMHVRTRRPQKDAGQYEKMAEQGEFHRVREGRYEFLVNFTDYLDTGLFLDHRLTRQRIADRSKGRRFLNLFAYTGTATVYAVGAGAAASTTVDMSKTYLEWAKRNLALNQLAAPAHGFVQADCLAWLAQESQARSRTYDLIFIDPPTYSRSKRMEQDFDVQRDHVDLLLRSSQLLNPGGMIVFSNNYTRFKLDSDALANAGFAIDDWSRATIPRDFERNQKIHVCFALTRKG